MAEVLEGESVGVAIKDFDQATVSAGLDQLLALVADPGASARCVEVAHKYFSLVDGVLLYSKIYKELS